MSTENATARPWAFDTGEDGAVIYAPDIGTIAKLDDDVCSMLEHKANAALIVRAVNHLDAHLAVAEAADSFIKMWDDELSCIVDECDAVQSVRAALAKLEEAEQ